jgi:cell division septation protein DedD
MRILSFAICAFLAAPISARAEAALDDVEVSTDQVIFVLDHPVKEKIRRLEKPDRLVIDLPKTFPALAQGVFDGQGLFLAQVRAEQAEASSGTARIVLDLKAPASYQARWKGARLTVRLFPAAPKKPTTAPAPKAAEKPKQVEKPQATGKGFLLQAGAFSKKETALGFKEELEPAVPGWSVSTTTVKSVTLYRLRAGPFATRAEAESAVKKLAAMGEKAVVLPSP